LVSDKKFLLYLFGLKWWRKKCNLKMFDRRKQQTKEGGRNWTMKTKRLYLLQE